MKMTKTDQATIVDAIAEKLNPLFAERYKKALEQKFKTFRKSKELKNFVAAAAAWHKVAPRRSRYGENFDLNTPKGIDKYVYEKAEKELEHMNIDNKIDRSDEMNQIRKWLALAIIGSTSSPVGEYWVKVGVAHFTNIWFNKNTAAGAAK